jgi:hypothetical protein
MKHRNKKTPSPSEAFMALPDGEKERIWESFNRDIPLSETEPLSAEEQVELKSAQRAGRARRARERRSRAKLQRVNVQLRAQLLKRADAYAANHGMSRTELIARGIELAIAS